MTARRPSYSEAIADEICMRVADGESLRQVCADPRIPARRTVQVWVLDDVEGFSARYSRARDLMLEGMVDEMLEISDDPVLDPKDKRVRIDTRKWQLSKLKPERYGDSLKLTGGLDLNTRTDEQLDARLAVLLGKARIDGAVGGEGAPEEAA